MYRIVWGLVLAAILVAGYVLRVHREMVDFEVYQQAGSRVQEAAELYRPEDGHYQFKYLPAFAIPMIPFARMPDAVARAVWYSASCLLLVVLVGLSVRLVPDKRLSVRALVWFAILFMGKFYVRELNLGQTNILLGTVLVFALAALVAKRTTMAAVLIGTAIFVKPYAAILLPLLWLEAGTASAGVALAVAAIGLAAPIPIYGWQGNLRELQEWYRTVTQTTAPNLLVPENVSFAATWTKWIGAGQLANQMALVTSVVALAEGCVVLAYRRGVTNPAVLEFGLFLLLVPLLSPQGWDYVLLLGTPAVLIVVDRWRDTPLPWKLLTAVSIFLMSFTLFDVFGRKLYGQMMKINIVTLAVMGLVACIVRLRMKKLA